MGSILSLFVVHNCGDEDMNENEIPVGRGPFNVYLLFAGNMIPGDTAQSDVKRSHSFVIIDWGNKSDNTFIIGKKYDLTAQASTQATILQMSKINLEFPCEKTVAWHKVGEIDMPEGSDPELFFYEFQANVRRFNINWECERGKVWNSSNNCQQYARALIGHFKWQWPTDAFVIGDSLPIIIDNALHFNTYIYSVRNRLREKGVEKNLF
eukprot:Phypoly_transcript_18271.p1 GENE.Phypoly_transcript_18271~~Phypoly_transcript_18271.p1  ORF type:complete len:209 (+),score=12.33 Phypoly_transcript_18271:119-745(+)